MDVKLGNLKIRTDKDIHLRSLKTDVEFVTSDELVETKELLEKTREELTATREELTETEATLDATRGELAETEKELADAIAAQIKAVPLEVTANGTYTANDKEAFNPVSVKVASIIKRTIDKTKDAGVLFKNCQYTDMTHLIEYNDTENATIFTGMFQGCSASVNFPLLNTDKATMMYQMHSGCLKMEVAPSYNMANVVDVQGMFNGCTALKSVKGYDVRNVYTFSRTFNACSALEEVYFKNIKVNLQVGSGTAWGHLLTLESLIYLIGELIQQKVVRTLTIGSANLEKLANVYVRLIEITDEMREQDDLIDEKMPFELCEITDEGAMLITEYALQKNWQIAG